MIKYYYYTFEHIYEGGQTVGRGRCQCLGEFQLARVTKDLQGRYGKNTAVLSWQEISRDQFDQMEGLI